MTAAESTGATLARLDDATRALVRLAAVLAGGGEDEVRAALHDAQRITPPEWIDELLLQTYLFAGFPRALNGMREWRRIHRTPATPADARDAATIRAEGERTCARVYGPMYEKLRVNVRDLHPLLDEWMVVEGYGKVLSRSALDLGRRELCIVAACTATAQDRQLHSHLHGARNVGVPDAVVDDALASLRGLVPEAARERAVGLWARIRNDVH
jgi:4-carboxymuconolactone decarboxylase